MKGPFFFLFSTGTFLTTGFPVVTGTWPQPGWLVLRRGARFHTGQLPESCKKLFTELCWGSSVPVLWDTPGSGSAEFAIEELILDFTC